MVIGSNSRVKQISQVRRSRSSLSSFVARVAGVVEVVGLLVGENVPYFSVFCRLRGGGELESVGERCRGGRGGG